VARYTKGDTAEASSFACRHSWGGKGRHRG
jgi:hypothetical protein